MTQYFNQPVDIRNGIIEMGRNPQVAIAIGNVDILFM